MNNFIPFFVIIPLGAAFLISLVGKLSRRLADFLATSGGFGLLALSFFTLWILNSRAGVVLVYKVGGWVPPIGICMAVDNLSSLMLSTVNTVSFLVLLYSLSYMEKYTDKWKFYTLFMLMLAGMNGIMVTGDLFNLFVFLEIASISSYALVAFGTEAEELEASFKYAVMGSLASSFVLLGIALLYSYTSTLNMADIGRTLAAHPAGLLLNFVAVLFLAGFGLKAALVPFHAWLPDAHPSAPAPISAMLSGVFIKVLGVYALSRVFFNILGVSQGVLFILLILGTVSMVAGAFLAIGQSDIKRMFAYSSVSQIGYIILAFGIGSPLAIFGGLFHLINHAFFKSLLFLNSGAIEYSAESRDLKKLGGLKEGMPFTAATGIVGSLAISGLPPLGGFFSKLIIILAAVQAGYLWLGLAAALVSILTLAYYLKFIGFAFLGKLPEGLAKIKEVPLAMRLAMLILAVACLASGLLVAPLFKSLLQSASDCLLLGTGYAERVFSAIR